MARKRHTDRSERPFSEATIEQVWNKGRVFQSYDANIWRHDLCGSVIKRGDHGNVNSKHCWEIDHIKCRNSVPRCRIFALSLPVDGDIPSSSQSSRVPYETHRRSHTWRPRLASATC